MKNAWAKFRGWTWWQQTLGWIGAAFVGLIILGAIVGEEDTGSSGESQADQKEASEKPAVTCAPLTVSKPRDGSVVHKRRVQIRGKATPNASVAFSDYDEGGGLGRTHVRADGSLVRTVTLPGVGHTQILLVVRSAGCPRAEFALDVTRKRTAAQLAAIRQKKADAKIRKAAARQQFEANYKASTATPDYNQLAKNPDRYKGDKVKFRGQIFQIQEDEGGGWIASLSDGRGLRPLGRQHLRGV